MEQNRDTDVRPTRTKTLTCRQLGGPCDLAHLGGDANEIIKAHDRHLNEAVAAGDTDHEPALKEMKGRWKRPISGMKWYRQVQRDVAALPDEPSRPQTPAESAESAEQEELA